MQLYLVRHAIAEPRSSTSWPNDADRPLSPRGKKRFGRAAHGLQQIVPKVDRVLASPLLRAWDTALLLHREANWPAPEPGPELGGGSVDEVIQLIERNMDIESLVLVGHEPQLNLLAARILSPGTPIKVEFRKGAVARFSLDNPAAASAATLIWLLQPRVLRKLS